MYFSKFNMNFETSNEQTREKLIDMVIKIDMVNYKFN